MNIGIVTTWFERGAAYVSRQYRDLLAAEHKVFIFARGGESSGRGDPAWDDGSVTFAERQGPKLPTWIDRSELLRWIGANSIGLVFFNEQHFWLPLVWCHEADVKTGAYVDYYTEATIPLFAAYDFLICNTKRHFSAFSWHDQAFYIPWGTRIEVFSPRSLDPVDPERVVFFHSAGVSPRRKGTDQAIDAFSRVKGPASLTIHTQVPLEKELPALTGMIDRLKREGRLQIIEKTVAAPGLYSLGDVYVYPSRLEGIGLTIAEALASGLPVIVPDQPPMNEFVETAAGNGAVVRVDRQYARSDGYYWPQCQVDGTALTDAMQEYVDRRADLGARKKKAIEFARARLDWSARRDSVCKAFEESRILKTEGKAQGLRACIAHEHGRSGRWIELWVKLPRLSAFVKGMGAAIHAAFRPLVNLAARFLN